MKPKDKTNKREKALVVFSGGQDSTTCLYWALKNFNEVHTITFGYGQNHSAEVECARKIAMREGVPFHYMDVSFIGTLSSNALTDKTITMDSESPEEGFPNTFVPGRNLFFISIAAVYAREHGIGNIITGVSQTDFSGYPDCRDSFIKSLNVTINLAMDEELDIITPLMWKDKAQTWKMADELGVMEIIRNETLTCYNGIIGDGCGECPSCKLRKRGLELYLEEKTKY